MDHFRLINFSLNSWFKLHIECLQLKLCKWWVFALYLKGTIKAHLFPRMENVLYALEASVTQQYPEKNCKPSAHLEILWNILREKTEK